MIAEISQFDTGDATNDGYLGLIVAQALQPICIKVFLPMQRQVVFNPMHHFRLLTNYSQ